MGRFCVRVWRDMDDDALDPEIDCGVMTDSHESAALSVGSSLSGWGYYMRVAALDGSLGVVWFLDCGYGEEGFTHKGVLYG